MDEAPGTDAVEFAGASALAVPLVRRFFDYWEGKKNGRVLPRRGDLDPVEFPWALGYVSIVEPRPGGRFFYALDGTATAQFFGADMTGRHLDEYPGAAHDTHVAAYEKIVQLRRPLRWLRDATIRHKRWHFEIALLPFSEDGKTVDAFASVLGVWKG